MHLHTYVCRACHITTLLMIVVVFQLQIYLIVFRFIVCSSGYSLLRDPHHNKGLAFTEKERDAHYIRGLLPPVVMSQALQVRQISFVFRIFTLSLVIILLLKFSELTYQEKKLLHNLRQYQVPLQKYTALMDLAVIF